MLGIKVVALMLAAALNPLVVRTPSPQGNVPADCEVSDRPAAPRVQIADAERETALPLPPVRTASARKTDFKELDRAIANNDRPAFDAVLERARAEGQPVRVYEDVGRLWDAQFESPFFAQGSDAYRIASNYPGYEEAMRPHVFTDASGRKFYPAAESRRFVAGLKPAATTRRASASRTTATARPKVASSRRSSSPSRRAVTPSPKPPSTTRPAAIRQPAASRDSAPPSSPDPSAPPPQTAAAAPAPAAPPPVVDTQSTTTAPPAAGSLDTGVITTSPEPAAVTTTTTTPASPAAKGRPIILPAILILIGLGVLILLFRTKA